MILKSPVLFLILFRQLTVKVSASDPQQLNCILKFDKSITAELHSIIEKNHHSAEGLKADLDDWTNKQTDENVKECLKKWHNFQTEFAQRVEAKLNEKQLNPMVRTMLEAMANVTNGGGAIPHCKAAKKVWKLYQRLTPKDKEQIPEIANDIQAMHDVMMEFKKVMHEASRSKRSGADTSNAQNIDCVLKFDQSIGSQLIPVFETRYSSAAEMKKATDTWAEKQTDTNVKECLKSLRDFQDNLAKRVEEKQKDKQLSGSVQNLLDALMELTKGGVIPCLRQAAKVEEMFGNLTSEEKKQIPNISKDILLIQKLRTNIRQVMDKAKNERTKRANSNDVGTTNDMRSTLMSTVDKTVTTTRGKETKMKREDNEGLVTDAFGANQPKNSSNRHPHSSSSEEHHHHHHQPQRKM